MTVSDILKRDKNNLDIVRIIVATMVIWSHSFALSQGNGANEPLSRFLKVTYAGELGVNIFFFISGLLVTNSILKKGSITKFVVSRFFRIFPALLLLLVITTFIIGPIVSKLSVIEYFSNSATWKYFLQNIYLKTNYILPGSFENNIWPNDVNGSLWSLTYEVACYIFLIVVFVLSGNNKNTQNKIIFVITILSIIPNHFLLHFFERTYIPGFVPMACFAFGSFFAVNQEKIKLDFKLLFALVLSLVLFWRYIHLIQILFPLTISVFLLFFSTDKFVLKLKPKYDISYGLYIWHFLIQQIIILYIGSFNVYLFFIVSFVLTVLLAFLSFVLVEERSINYGYKLGNRIVNSGFNYERLIIYSVVIIGGIILAKLI